MENIDFYNATFLNGLGFTDPSLFGYNLLTSFAPITANPINLTPTFGGGSFATTGTETVQFLSNDSLTFTAAVEGVPEPATLALFGLGLAGLRFSRRKQ